MKTNKIGPIENYPDNTMTEVEVDGKHILVVNNGKEIFLTNARCPHLGGKLAKGTLEGSVVTCPLHGSKFDVETGKVILWTRYSGLELKLAKATRHPHDLQTYNTKIEEGILYLGDPK